MDACHPWLKIDTNAEIERIVNAIRRQVRQLLRKKGALVAVSGGIDSSVCASLCVRALGAEHVFALSLPERDSSDDSLKYGRLIAGALGVQFEIEDITRALDGAGCYRLQLDAIRKIFPEYQEGWKHKITLPSLLESTRLNLSSLTVQNSAGELKSARMPLPVYLQLIAATNLKQRTRKMLEYSFADRFNLAVCGTPNRLEYDQGFFVKQGDGSADFKPIAHLYKSQVYQLAAALQIPEVIRKRTPTTDTFSLPQTQEEFYFSVPYQQMDICLYGANRNLSAVEVAREAGLTPEQVGRVYDDIEKKRRATIPLHLPPLLVEEIPQIHSLIEAIVHQSEEN